MEEESCKGLGSVSLTRCHTPWTHGPGAARQGSVSDMKWPIIRHLLSSEETYYRGNNFRCIAYVVIKRDLL